MIYRRVGYMAAAVEAGREGLDKCEEEEEEEVGFPQVLEMLLDPSARPPAFLTSRIFFAS